MYKIYYNDTLLYDPRSDDQQLADISISQKTNEADELTFIQPPTNDLMLEELSHEIYVLNDDVEVFRGEITNIEKQGVNKKIKARSALSYLNRSQVRAFDTLEDPELVGITPSGFVFWLIQQHNEQCFPPIKIGVNDADLLWNRNVFVRSSDTNMSVAECLKDRLLKTLGGYVRMRHENGNHIFDYLADFSDVSAQTVEFGENLLSFADSTDANKVFTAVIPYGETDEETEIKLDISSIQDATYNNYLKRGDMLTNVKASNRYGIRVATIEDTDLITAQGVMDAGIKYIDSVCAPVRTLKLRAFDLSFIDDVEPISIGSYVRCKAKPYGFNAFMACTEAKIDISQPENTTFTLGRPPEKLTGSALKSVPDLIEAIDEVVIQVPSISKDAKDAAEAAQRAETAAEGKSRNYITTEDPTASESVLAGDTWYNPLTRKTYIYKEL